MVRGAPPVRSLAEISNAFLDVFGFGGSCRFRLCASLLWWFACYHLNDCMSSDVDIGWRFASRKKDRQTDREREREREGHRHR